VALGASPGTGGANGKFMGLVAGLVLLAILGFAIYRLVAPLFKEHDEALYLVLLILGLLWVVKTAALVAFPGFGADVASYQAWALQIAGAGPAHTYQHGYFLDYPPGYLYALWLAGLIAKAAGAGGTALRVIVESPALVADLFLAAAVFAWVQRSERAPMALVAMLMVALNPALLFDTVVWGQSDSVMTLVMWLSVAAAAGSEFELAWALAAISVLVKPQGLMLVPVLGWWTLLKGDFGTCVRSALTAGAVFVIGVLPFQVGHPWNWIINLYVSTAAYYHETSVNAFNLMALIGGLRRPDSGHLLGISYYALGMGMLVPLYAFVAWTLWRVRTARGLYFASFVALFGFFMLAPRMHERYLYPALVFAVPLALESTDMLVVFAVLTVSCLVNLAYVKHALETVVFLKARDGVAMAMVVLNLGAFALAVRHGLSQQPAREPVPEQPAHEQVLQQPTGEQVPQQPSGEQVPQQPADERVPAADPAPVSAQPCIQPEPEAGAERRAEESAPIQWLRVDTIVIVGLIVAAVATRFWRLGTPNEIVFDEVHFVGQARHYLHGEPFLDPHPPLAKLVIAFGIWLFGDHPWAWRFGNAVLGTALVGITYMFGRRVLHSRLGGALAGGFVLCDGMFLVDSRTAVIDIVYLTFAALAYLLLFRFIQTRELGAKRRVLPWIGVALGLALAGKLYIPAFTCVLVAGFVAYHLWSAAPSMEAAGAGARDRRREWRIVAGLTIVAAVTTMVYLLVFLPHFILGWWGGISDLFHYYSQVIWYEGSVASATHPYASPWWSWPLMLRPIAYWQHFPKAGDVATVWGGGNPLPWWGALVAITITGVYVLERPSVERAFLVTGYLGYLLMWVWIGRTLFLYHYMPSVYLGFVALGGVLAQCWEGRAEPWEHAALLVTIASACVLGLGVWAGTTLFAGLLAAYGLLMRQPLYAGRLVFGAFVAGTVILFVYFFPLWTAIPISRAGYYARMWLQGPGLRNWI
jgi:Gpi18-like mannosyltransferase/predicted membrane-bound dolichyl-phosphate-mannose-protein mannosyltransferase